MKISDIIKANLSRVERWHSLNSWSPLEWAGAMCGEAGEAANSAKKLKRVQDQIANNDGRLFGLEMSLTEQEKLYAKQIGMEVADTIIYSVLLCARVGVDLEACIKEAFNQKSEEYGFPERLGQDEFYVLVEPWAVYVKEKQFFIDQGGLQLAWGTRWQHVYADSIEHARELGAAMRS